MHKHTFYNTKLLMCLHIINAQLNRKQQLIYIWFTTMFRDEYVPPVERERLAQEFLTLKQGTESVTMMTMMFHERAMFYPEHVSSDQACMSRYLSILRRDIREFVANSTYRKFAKLQANARKREIELETQGREEAESQGRDR